MGVYEDLLKRKKIVEDENGNVTVNAVVNKDIRDNLTNNNIQTYSNDNYKTFFSNIYSNAKNSLWNKIKTIATTPANGNNRFNILNNVVRNNVGKIDTQRTIEEQASQNFDTLNLIKKTQNSVKSYQKAKEETLKKSLEYIQLKKQNPNMSEKELLKKAEEESNTLQKNLMEYYSELPATARTIELKKISTSDSNPLFYDDNKFRKINNAVLQYKTTKEAQETAKKINNDLENGKIGSSVGHILEALPQKTMEAVASPIYSTGSLLNLKLRTGTADQDLQDWKVISSKYDKTTANINNDTVKTASNVSGTIGYMVPSILASIVAPETNLGRITQGISVGGQSYIENLNDDASNKFQSAITGLGKGYASYAIEGITGGNILGKGSLDDLAVRTIASKTSNKAVKKIASTIYEVGGEVFEEEVENQTGYLIDKIVNDKGISLKDWLNEQEETVKNTVLSTLVLKVLGLGGNVYNDVENYNYNAETKKWINEAEKIIQKENLTIDLDRFKVNNNIKEVNNVLKQLQQENNTLNSQPQSTQNQPILPTQQVNQQENKVAQNGNMEQNIANNQETLYNNSNESESDLNERNNGQVAGRNDEATRVYEKRKSQQTTEIIGQNEQGRVKRLFPTNEGRQGNVREYQTNNERQKEIDYIRDSNNHIIDLNSNQKRIENRYKDIGVPVKFYSFDSIAGGRYDNGTLYINTYNMTDEQQANVAVHEYAHHLLRDNINFQNEVSLIADKIISSENEGRTEAIRNYIMDRDENITIDEINKVYEIALEEILADYMIDIDNNVDFNVNNQYRVDIKILDEYKNLVQKYLPKKLNNIPIKQDVIKLPQKETNVDKYNRYKKEILQGRAEEVNNLIKNKNETINEIEKQIKEKTQLLNNKKDKTTKVSNNLKMQIENLKQRKSKIENEYNSRIDRKFHKVTKDKINLETKKGLGITRKEIQQNLLEDTGILNESLDNAKNISMANMNRTDPIRLQEKVFGRELGTKINDMFFNKIKHNTANKTRFLNSERNDIKNWGIKARSFESEVLQKYTEKTYVTEEGNEIAYTDADLIKDIPNEETRNKIKKASEELRKKYDNYIETANEVLVGLGYDAIPKRKDYVRHFTELNDIFTRFGIPGKLDNSLPTDINGITDTFRPGKNFFANAQRRLGNKTTYDAITGIDGYIEGISNLIYHTEDIQRLRALDKYIREEYGEKGFENLDNLSEEDKKIRIQKISENHLSNYVSWLTEYTNNLAGKKSGIDRSVEKLLGRNIYSALDTIKKQTGSNMTGFNIGSALTNFISITQGASKTKKLALLKGTASTIKNIFNDDGFVEKSDFLTNRFGSDRLSNNLWQKASNAGQIFMSATDYFSSNLIVRSKYYENLAKGMSKTEALKKADDFGARILGDRSQGATANVFNSKMLGILTQFQLEVNNQLDTMMHDTVQDFKITSNENGNLKASMGAVWTLGQMAVYQYAFNEIFQAVAGRRPAFDIIDIIKTALGVDDDDDEDTLKDNLQEASVKLVEALPFINLLSEDARIPIVSAIPNPISIATGESKFKDEMSKLVYLLPPTGGSQFKKSIEGIKTVKDGGSYVINSKGEKELRFPVENANIGDYIKAGVLGKYALPLAEEYTNRDYKRLSAKQTKTYEESNLPYKQYLDYIDAGLKTNEEKINYLESKEMTEQQRWGIYKNDLFSSTERKEDGGSQLKDAEHITSNGVSKSEYIKIYNKAQKNNIDMPTATEYDEMKSNNIKLNNYIDCKIKVKDLTNKKKQSEELTETQELKNADKIQILLDSDYTDKEIAGIYSSYIKNKQDTEYDVISSTGINIKEYLKYKQQDFTSDKEDDGTLDGKTVSKSKQKKVENYLNSMNIDRNQRLLLYAMQGYSIESSQKSQLAQYVYNLKLDKDTKLELYNKFSGFKVYKDGRVQW